MPLKQRAFKKQCTEFGKRMNQHFYEYVSHYQETPKTLKLRASRRFYQSSSPKEEKQRWRAIDRAVKQQIAHVRKLDPASKDAKQLKLQLNRFS